MPELVLKNYDENIYLAIETRGNFYVRKICKLIFIKLS